MNKTVKVAKTAGFCFGVQKAVETVYKILENNVENKKIYTYGPIIHNEEVVNDLESKGVKVIHNINELEAIRNQIIIIRSHGVDKNTYDVLKSNNQVIDATCPFVKKIHKIVMKTEKDTRIVIVGDPNHPEVKGIIGWCSSHPIVINNENDANNLDISPYKKMVLVSQTTYNFNKFNKLVEIIVKKGYDIYIANTICNSTNERQTEARKLAVESEAMIVIGGKNSSNTQKLYEICKEECTNTYYIQTLVDLDISQLQSIGSIGITAGASTPNNIIEEVQKNVIRI